MTTPTFLALSGTSFKSGSPPTASLARSIFSFSMISGITRIAASFSPLRTTKPEARVAIIISPSELIVRRRSTSTSSSPSMSATSSILPSFGSEACMCSFWQSERSTSAASSSWSMFSLFSQM